MPSQGQKTPLQPIIDAIVARLVTVLELPEDQEHLVMFSRTRNTPRFQGDQDVVLRLTGARPLPGFMEGHGIIAPGVRRGLIVQLRTRASRDVSDRIDNWLYTHLPREDQILLALIGFHPLDEDESVLTIQEMRVENLEEYEDEVRQIPPDDPSWGSSLLIFAIDYNPVAPDLPPEE